MDTNLNQNNDRDKNGKHRNCLLYIIIGLLLIIAIVPNLSRIRMEINLIRYRMKENEAREKRERNEDLINAINKGDANKVKSLLEKGADINEHSIYYGTPLITAVKHGKTDIVNILLENGADVNMTHNQSTALTEACQKEHTEIIKLLLKKRPNVNKYNPIQIAVEKENIEIVQLLIEAEADMDSKVIYKSIELKNEKLLEMLLEGGASPNPSYYVTSTPLHHAVEAGSPNMVRLLVEAGAELNKKNTNGQTPLDLAHRLNNVRIRHILQQAGAKRY